LTKSGVQTLVWCRLIVDIYLIRHTKVKIKSGICYGQTDVALTENFNFTTELKNVQARIAALPKNTVIISSPLQRCLQLAEKLNFGNSNPVIIDKRIMELNFGDWEMQKWDDINQKLLQEWMNDYVNIAPPRGESFQALFERSQDFWIDNITNLNLLQKTCQAVVVVTHLGVIRALLAQVLEMPLKKSLCIQVDYGAVNKLKYHTDDKTNQAWITVEYLNKN